MTDLHEAAKQALEALALFASDESEDGMMAAAAYFTLLGVLNAASKLNTPKQSDSFNELVRRVRETYGDAIILINQDELNVIHVKDRSK